MEYLLTIFKLIASCVAVFGALIGFAHNKFKRRSAMIAEYNHAKSFLKEADQLHPYARELGYQTVAGSQYVNPSEVEYVLTLQNPVKSLAYYVKGRGYFLPFDENKSYQFQFKERYQSKSLRKAISLFYSIVYFISALASISPIIFSQFIKGVTPEIYVASLTSSLLVFGILAYISLQKHLEIYFAECLFEGQEIHDEMRLVQS
ncbi:hypothetical protein RJ45_07415 [Photobacterium gaetbulicola]|uniref:Uncharacterized protein n=1 Tax=Photobacterium gaetbulicola TaxID=1295392 RepID=A0A0B9G6N3_9GAMM|nr:hypothetical protein [Photobacterium gaetbulicola]KHT64264.1 hypothetical protein RJ45_07415 [Photobacterium gaetbulicola]